eukprot:scaffold327863_cov59-Attheya_sp.AAC.4
MSLVEFGLPMNALWSGSENTQPMTCIVNMRHEAGWQNSNTRSSCVHHSRSDPHAILTSTYLA